MWVYSRLTSAFQAVACRAVGGRTGEITLIRAPPGCGRDYERIPSNTS